MAYCKDYSHIKCVKDDVFSKIFSSGDAVPHAGIYRCTVCNRELVFHAGSRFGCCKKSLHPCGRPSSWSVVVYAADRANVNHESQNITKKEELSDDKNRQDENKIVLYRANSIGYYQKITEVVQDGKRCKIYKKDGVVKLAIQPSKIEKYQKGDVITIEESLGLIVDIDEFLNRYEILIGRTKKLFSLSSGVFTPYISRKLDEKDVFEHNVWLLITTHGINYERAVSVIKGETKLEKAIANQKRSDRKSRIKRLMTHHELSKDLATKVAEGKITLLEAVNKQKNSKKIQPKGNDFYDNLIRVPGSYGSRQ